ncbi:MAG: hypothetical protein ACXVHR_08355, partial [Methanobacterium sp.]
MNREELQRRLINNNNNVDANSNISVSSSQQVINAQPLENNIMIVPRQFPSSEGVPSSSSSYSNSASGASSSTAVSNNSVPASEDELIRNIVPLHEDEYAMILQSYCDSQGITIEEYFNGANGNTNDRDPNRLGPVVLEDDGLDENL